MHGQPGHAAQVRRRTLPYVVVVAAKVLVGELRGKKRASRTCSKAWLFKKKMYFAFAPPLTASPSLHFQLPLSVGFLRFSPIQNQCCSCSSDSLQGEGGHHQHRSTQRCPLRGSHPPEGLVEHLQDEVLLLGAADAHQVGAVSLAEQVGLQPGQLLLRVRGVEDLQRSVGAMRAG